MADLYYPGKKVSLKPLEKDAFLKAWHSWWNNPEATHFMVYGREPLTEHQVEEWYTAAIVAKDEIWFFLWDNAEEKYIGVCGLHHVDPVVRSAEFRIFIGETSSWGKGLGTEATKLCLAYGFERQNLNKIWLGVSSDNAGAVKAYKKAGFTEEGVLREDIYRNNRYYDAIRMSMLKKEYDALEKDP